MAKSVLMSFPVEPGKLGPGPVLASEEMASKNAPNVAERLLYKTGRPGIVRAPTTMSETEVTTAAKMKSKGGVMRVFNALRYSLHGFAAAWRDEHAFRQELLFVAPLIVGAFFLPVAPTQRALLVGAGLLVLIVELLNSAVEAAVDLVTQNHHLLAKKAKDIGSAAVLLCLANLGITWACVLWERFGW